MQQIITYYIFQKSLIVFCKINTLHQNLATQAGCWKRTYRDKYMTTKMPWGSELKLNFTQYPAIHTNYS